MRVCKKKYPARNPDTAWRAIEEETVVVYPRDGMIRVLNETGNRIWELCDGNISSGDIAGVIHEEFEVSLEDAMSDVDAFLASMDEKGLIRWLTPTPV